ncbi:MAG TPA: alanyl-tRNA editing protein [Burkholderiaceae bacterium]|nr:alanyl-tRNA editing protein [Burkholderiaceae bacterium]
MTRKLFWDDPYLRMLDTTVETVMDDCITLRETIFYAFSGGQESDAGTIGGHAVLEARKDGLQIVYRLADGYGLRAGDPVRIEIDWERRYRLMRLHFAAEVVLELFSHALNAVGTAEKIGAHIAADKARIDFQWPQNIALLFPQITAAAQKLIDSDQPIISSFDDETGQRRYWEVPGFARVPCGGTHLKRTGEVGVLSLQRKNVGKGKERVMIHVKP